MAEQKLSSQGTEVNKNSTSYTSVVSPQKKKKKKKEKKNKEGVWGQTTLNPNTIKINIYYFKSKFSKQQINGIFLFSPENRL